MPLTPEEQALVTAVDDNRDDLVKLASDLVAFNTVTRSPGEKPHEERALQEYLAERLRRAGAEVEVWEPSAEEVAPSRQLPAALDFTGYPQLAARFRGSGRASGRSLMFNGHIDVVSPEPFAGWTHPPFEPTVEGNRLYGRGSCDMKGGVAAMVFAAEVLARSTAQPVGELIVSTVTDEESTSAGGVASIAHGLRADAAVVTEPTGLDVALACRGSLIPTVTVRGRAGHAAAVQPRWQDGGAVNAIEKAAHVVRAVQRLRESWNARVGQHPYLPPASIIPTLITAGQWEVSYPAECRIVCHVSYLPGQADEKGYGTEVEKEVEAWLGEASASDEWLSANPPEVEWSIDVPPSEVPADHPVVRGLLGACADTDVASSPVGAQFWNDGASFHLLGSIPSVCFGPGSIEVAHTVDEYVPVEELIGCAKALALLAHRFCGGPSLRDVT